MTAVILILLLFTSLMAGRTQAQEVVLPTATPDAEAGLAIYADRCAVCHGPLGQGDGQMALDANLEPRDFTDPAYQLTADPQLMFEVITNGSLANGMPPFGGDVSNPLSEAQRWDLIAAVFSFGTSVDRLDAGERVFAELDGNPADIPEAAYWFSHSNEAALADLAEWGIETAALSDEDKLALLDYGRAQTYQYSNPFAALEASEAATAAAAEPIETATVSGLVVNGSTSENLSEGEALLRAFTMDLQEQLTLTTTIGADGRYTFNLEDVLPNWVYLISTDYNDLTFTSDANRLTPDNPELSMPIIVYDVTNDPDVVSVAQVHMILNFVEDAVQVSELYVFNNNDNAVFVGESGDFNEGTVEIILPAGATNVNFQRSFGSVDNFAPASEVIETGTGWADTVPLRPGEGTTTLLASYQLPYEDGLGLAHPLVYETAFATVIVPDVGVDIEGEGWVEGGGQSLPGGNYLTFTNADVAGSDVLNLALDGRPRELLNTQGNALIVRDNTQELIIGAIGLGLTFVVGFVLVRQWQQPPVPEAASDTTGLLQAIAELDDAFEAGEIEPQAYEKERERLKADLIAVWPRTVTDEG